MRKDPTEFRERFKKWQSGEKVYEGGLPKYEGGTEDVKTDVVQDRTNAENAVDAANAKFWKKGVANKMSAESYQKMYRNSAGFRSRFNKSIGASNDDVFYKMGLNTYNAPTVKYGTQGDNFFSPNRNTVYMGSDGGDLTGGLTGALGHELGHTLYQSKYINQLLNMGSNIPLQGYKTLLNDASQLSSWKRQVEQNTGKSFDYTHDHNIIEGGADANSLGLLLYQDGVFNRMDKNANITKEELKSWYDGYKKKNPNGHRFIETYGVDNAAFLLNNTAKADTRQSNPNIVHAKCGLENFKMPKFEEGAEPDYQHSSDFISKYEGWSDTAYQKKGDVPTIGYGTTNPKWVNKGRITRDLGIQAMHEDLAANEPLLRKNIKDYDRLPDTAKTVLRDILYNVGQGNMFRKSPKFIDAMNAGNYEEAARQMDWDENKPGFGGAKVRNQARREMFLLDLKKNHVKPRSQLVQLMYDKPEFQPGFQYTPTILTDYSLTNRVGGKLNSWNGAGSPAYGGASVSIPSLYQVMEQNLFKPRK